MLFSAQSVAMVFLMNNIPTPPDNPHIAVLRFLPVCNNYYIPSMGTMIAELLVMRLWQSPCLNLYHHWHIRQHMKIYDKTRVNLPNYIRQIKEEIPCDIFVIGRYKIEKSKIVVIANIYKQKPTGSRAEIIATATKQGDIDNLTSIVNACADELIMDWFPPAHALMRKHHPPLIDVSIDALQWICAAFDLLSYDNNEIERCSDYLDHAFELNPESVYLQFMAEAFAHHKRWSAELCSRLVSRHENFTPAYFPIGSLNADGQELALAQELYMSGLRSVPFNIHAYYGLREICIRCNDTATLIKMCQRHVARGSFSSSDSEFGDTFLTTAELSLEENQYDMAREVCEAGLKLAEDPDDMANLLRVLASVEEEVGNYHAADNYYNKSLTIHNTVEISIAYARFLWRVKRYDELRLTCQQLTGKSLQNDPIGLEATYLLARAYDEQGRREQAKVLYARLSEEKPQSAEVYTYVFDASVRLKEMRDTEHI